MRNQDNYILSQIIKNQSKGLKEILDNIEKAFLPKDNIANEGITDSNDSEEKRKERD